MFFTFVKASLSISLFWTGAIMLTLWLVGVLSGKYHLPPYVVIWTFIGLFLGTLIGLCFNYGGGAR
jgi:hypothetical protein